jgi:Xaa-Pro aminopeptidase
MSYPTRRAALRALLGTAEPAFDALLVSDLINVRYLTGFTGSNAALLLHVAGDDASRFCTDGRYRIQTELQVPDLPVLIERVSARALAAAAAESGVSKLGFESDHVTVDARDELAEAATGVSLCRAPGLVRRLRTVKDDAEIDALRAACAATDAALADLLAAGGLRAVAIDLEQRLRDHGASGPAFDTIVAAGANSAVPHHQPDGTELRRGDLVTMDFGALIDGYHSDMTRTVVLGPAAAWQRELYDLVGTAQRAGRAALAPGTKLADVDSAARTVVDRAGRAEQFVHPLGHGVGLQIHEAPLLAATSEGTLSAGMVLTVEPGVYLAGRGGVRTEDTLLVRDGAPLLLTTSRRELLEID